MKLITWIPQHVASYAMDATQALLLLGENSRWHVRTYLFYSLGVMLASPLFIMSPVFIGKFITTCMLLKPAAVMSSCCYR